MAKSGNKQGGKDKPRVKVLHTFETLAARLKALPAELKL